MKAPNKIYLSPKSFEIGEKFNGILTTKTEGDIEYTRTDAFIEKAREWFEIQNEGVDYDGNYKCDMTDFEDFRKYMKGE